MAAVEVGLRKLAMLKLERTRRQTILETSEKGRPLSLAKAQVCRDAAARTQKLAQMTKEMSSAVSHAAPRCS